LRYKKKKPPPSHFQVAHPIAAATFTPVAPLRLEDWNRMNSTFQAITGYYTQDISETSGPLPEKITEAYVAPRFFAVWGVAPSLGRGFTSEEQRVSGHPVAVITDRLWRRHFGADPNVLGKKLRFPGGGTRSIIGVMPAWFQFPLHDVDFWAPLPLDDPVMRTRNATYYTVAGRLKPGVTLAQALSDLAAVQAQLGNQYPRTDANIVLSIESMKELTVGGVRRSLWILFSSVTVLLLITCTNIAALLLARTAERQREVSIRYSLGASRGSIVMQLLTEIFVLALAGSALAVFAAGAASKVFRTLARTLPRVEEIHLDSRLVVYALACAAVTTLLCGLFPAIRGTRRSLAGSLAQTSRTQVSGRNTLQWLLVSVQVALSVTLLVGAGLLLRSLQALGRVSPGFDPAHVLTLRISASWAETVNFKGMRQRIDRDLDALRNIPGVQGAATSYSVPGVPLLVASEMTMIEGPANPDQKILASARTVSPGYFSTMHIPLLAGEPCGESPVASVVVNRSFVDSYLSGRAAIGNHLQFVPAGPYMQPAVILGIVGDAREEGLQHAPGPVAYFCNSAPTPFPAFLIRTPGNPMAMAETVRRKLHEVEPLRSIYEIRPLEEHLGDTLAENRLRTTLLTFFALTAIALACVGLYGTLGYSVSVRRREIGLRLALGALRSQIVSHFLWEGVRASALGCLAGVGLAVAFTRELSAMLYGVGALDTPTFMGVAALVLLTATLAALLPSARAARVDPMSTLRDE
jgi:putative ABC transport system permease protein